MLTAEENDLLCRVEGDAPMGQIMRRHWMPACLIEEVAEPDGAPVKVRLLGEDLVVFRDSDGRLGVIDEYCPHRRVSLAYRPQRGMRAALPLSRLEDGRGRQRARDGVGAAGKRLRREGEDQSLSGARRPAASCGPIWARPTTMPEFEAPAFAPTPNARVSIVKIHVACNWAQILEGQIDSAHSSSLHSSDMKPAKVDAAKAIETHWLRPSTDKAPRLQVERTILRLSLCGDPPPDRECEDARLRPQDRLHRAVHRADSAEQRI